MSQELSKVEIAKAIADATKALEIAESAIRALNLQVANASGPMPAHWQKFVESSSRMQDQRMEEIELLKALEKHPK